MYPDFRNYVPDPRLQHRDQAAINLENKIATRWSKGISSAAIALELGLPRAVVEAVVLRNAPTPKK